MIAALLFMAWLAGLLHFHKIAPGADVGQGRGPGRHYPGHSETQIPRELEVLGEVVSKSLAQISAQVPGRVSKIRVEAGDRVKPGDTLITLSGRNIRPA